MDLIEMNLIEMNFIEMDLIQKIEGCMSGRIFNLLFYYIQLVQSFFCYTHVERFPIA